MSAVSPLAFVLMPFDADFDDIYSELIKKPLEEVGFTVRRADSLLNQRGILHDVVRGIADADLIVADVSGLNANVLYELGLAHALGKRTIMLTQDIDQLPFDLRAYRANAYSTRFTDAGALREVLLEIGKAVLRGDADFSNPVQDYAPDALVSQSQVALKPRKSTSAPRGDSADSSENLHGSADDEDGDDDRAEDDPGVFELALSMQSGSERTLRTIEQITQKTNAIGESFSTHTGRLNAAQKNLGEKGGQVMLAIMRDAAKDLHGYAEELEPLNNELRSALYDVARGANAIARFRAQDLTTSVDEIASEIANLEEVEESMATAYVGIADFALNIGAVPDLEASLSRAARKAARVVTDTADIVETGQSEISRARNLLVERMNRKS